MQLAPITIDFETYYDNDYSLRKLTTEEYIRDSRFEIIMVSTKVLGEAAEWFTGTLEEIRAYLQSKMLDRRMVIAHNARFDIAILEWHLGIVPKFIADTLSMARGLVGLMTRVSLAALLEFFGCKTRKGDAVIHMLGKRRKDLTQWEWQQYGTYCCDDSVGTEEIFLRMMPAMLDSEMKLIDWTIRAFCEPELEIDGDLVDIELRSFMARQASLLAQCGVQDIAELRSDARMADLLINAGVEPPTKVSPATGEITWAFAKSDIEFMDLLDHEDEKVVALVEARIGSKTSVVKSRLERFRSIARRGLLPVPLGYASATPTRRWAGEEKINCQNLPRNKVKRDVNKAIIYDENKKPVIEPSPLRKAIRVRKGRKMAVADLSQIELRVNAWHSGQQDVLNLLRNGGDSYSDMASAIYGFEITKAMGKTTHTNERFVGKTAVLGCGYGCGGPKFQHMLKVGARRDFIVLPDESLDFAQNVVNAYRDKNDKIKKNWYRWNDALTVLALGGTAEIGPYRIADQKIWLPNGAYLYYPELQQREKQGRDEQGVEWSYYRMRHGRRCLTKIYGAKLVENITQAVARLFVSDALLRLQTLKYQDGRPFFKIPNMVHDELVTTFEDGADETWVREALKWAMTTPPSWAPDIPLAYEGELGYNYAECK